MIAPEPTLNSVGAETQTQPQTAAYSDVFELNETRHDACGVSSDVESAKSELPIVSQPRQLSAKGRTLIRQCFSENPLIELPVDHLVVAFTESQVQIILGRVCFIIHQCNEVFSC